MVTFTEFAVLGLYLAHYASGQYLTTTCPSVRVAKCPGTARLLTELCEGGTCSTSQQQQQTRRLTADPPETVVPTTITAGSQQSTPGDAAIPTVQPTWWGSKQQADFPADGVPQRVQPDPTQGIQPPETQQQQQSIVTHLETMYSIAPPPTATPGTSGTSRSTGGDVIISEGYLDGTNPATEVAAQLPPNTAAAAAAVEKPPMVSRGTPPIAAAVDKPYAGPDTLVTNRKLTYISNTKIKVGLDMDRAGVITWVSSPYMPTIWKDRNVVNFWDQGRLLQQSYYGCVDGSCWATRPWLWNPVQGGSWENYPGSTAKQNVEAGKYLYVEGYPRNWGKQDLITDVLFSSNATVKDNYAEVKFGITYKGKVTHPYMTQEVPAVFVDRRFSVLAYYDGERPWTNDKVTYAFPGGKNIYARPTEFWAAWIDPDTGYGLGVFNPKAWMGITAYRIGDQVDDISMRPWFCSYFAHTIRMQLHPAMAKYEYKAFITLGTLAQIRATFYKLRATPGVMPRTAFLPGADGEIPAEGISYTTPETQGEPDLGRNAYFGQPANYSSFKNVVAGGRDEATKQPPTTPSGTGGDRPPAESNTASGAGTTATDTEQQYVETGEGAASGQVKEKSRNVGGHTYVIIGVVGAAVVGTAMLVGAGVLARRLQARQAAATADLAGPGAPAATAVVAGQSGVAGVGDATASVAVEGSSSKGGKGGRKGPRTRSSAALASGTEAGS